MSSAEISENASMLANVKSWLRSRHISQRKLAEKLGVSEPTVSKWLKGSQSMTLAQFRAIAQLLNAQPHQLLFPPGEAATADRFRDVVEIAEELKPDQLSAWVGVGRAMKPPSGS